MTGYVVFLVRPDISISPIWWGGTYGYTRGRSFLFTGKVEKDHRLTGMLAEIQTAGGSLRLTLSHQILSPLHHEHLYISPDHE
jgi:hypothetical protein